MYRFDSTYASGSESSIHSSPSVERRTAILEGNDRNAAPSNLSIACAFVSVVVRDSIDLSGRDTVE